MAGRLPGLGEAVRDSCPAPDSSPTCTICHEVSGACSVLDGCSHRVMCYECAVRWSFRNPTCPLCRKRFTTIASADAQRIHIVGGGELASGSSESESADTDIHVARPEELGYESDDGFVVADDEIEYSVAGSDSEESPVATTHSSGQTAHDASQRRQAALDDLARRRLKQLSRIRDSALEEGGQFSRSAVIERMQRALRRQELQEQRQSGPSQENGDGVDRDRDRGGRDGHSGAVSPQSRHSRSSGARIEASARRERRRRRRRASERDSGGDDADTGSAQRRRRRRTSSRLSPDRGHVAGSSAIELLESFRLPFRGQVAGTCDRSPSRHERLRLAGAPQAAQAAPAPRREPGAGASCDPGRAASAPMQHPSTSSAQPGSESLGGCGIRAAPPRAEFAPGAPGSSWRRHEPGWGGSAHAQESGGGSAEDAASRGAASRLPFLHRRIPHLFQDFS